MRNPGLFEPDVLIGELAGASRRHAAALSSEKRLMLAVLRNALECYQQHFLADDDSGREMFQEAAGWIENKDTTGLFSFESIAEALDIEPNYLRRQLANWRERRLEEAQRPVATAVRATSDQPEQDARPAADQRSSG